MQDLIIRSLGWADRHKIGSFQQTGSVSSNSGSSSLSRHLFLEPNYDSGDVSSRAISNNNISGPGVFTALIIGAFPFRIIWGLFFFVFFIDSSGSAFCSLTVSVRSILFIWVCDLNKLYIIQEFSITGTCVSIIYFAKHRFSGKKECGWMVKNSTGTLTFAQ